MFFKVTRDTDSRYPWGVVLFFVILQGLSQVPHLLDHLHNCILNLRVDEPTREGFLLRFFTLEDEFYRLSGYLLDLEEVTRLYYPEGVTLPDNQLTLLLRRGWGGSWSRRGGGVTFKANPKKPLTRSSGFVSFS